MVEVWVFLCKFLIKFIGMKMVFVFVLVRKLSVGFR